jgi:CPA1 family monovalent cation:H+ antiporter
VALVVTGLVLGTVHALEPPHLTKELLYAVFLPGLLFEASFHLEFRRFWQNKIAIHALAIPGVAAAIGITAALLTPAANALHFVEGFSFMHGLVFAALIAATDPIAVVALFKSLGAPKRLAVLVEGESLLNDGTAVVLYTLILGLVSGRELSAGAAALDFVKVVGMGMLIGTAIGFAVSKVIQKVDEPMIEITLTTIAAYGSFVAAEQLHFSGVIATVVAGMLCGNYAARTGMSPSTRIAVESFWEYVAFALNSIVFLLIGFEVRIEALLASWRAILVAYVAVMMARAAVIYVVSALIARTSERIPWSWNAVLTWGGLRGGLSMVLVLALPEGFPHRALLVTMTFGVVLLSILIQGLSMGPLLRRLGLVGVREERREYEVHRGQARAARAVLAELERMEDEGVARAEIVSELKAEYRGQASEAEERIRGLHLRAAELFEEERQAARRHALVVEKDAILEAYNKGLLGHEALEKLLEDVNARLLKLDDDHEPPEPAEKGAIPGESPADVAPPGAGPWKPESPQEPDAVRDSEAPDKTDPGASKPE